MKLDSIDTGKVAIFLDIDGTLLDIALRPHDVRVPPTLRKVLATLYDRTGGAIALVSGRALSDIDLIFSPLRLSAVGGHGAEIRPTPNGQAENPRPPQLDAETRKKLTTIAHVGDGIIVEDKGYSVALHFRLAPDKQGAIEDALAVIYADLPPGSVEILRGKAVIEIKKVGFNKGTALRDLMSHPPFAGRKPIFIGDDRTDETAFAVMPEFNGIAISVGRMVPGVAERFEAPSDVRRWLERLAKHNGNAHP